MEKKQRNLSNHKIFGHLERVQELKTKETCFPVCLEIHPTNKCMHNCFNCTSQDVRNKDRKMSIDGKQLKGILKQFAEFGGKAILWSGGGDPTLYHCPDSNISFKDIIHYANSLGLNQGVYTNGECLTPEIIGEIITSCTFIRFSLDSFTPATHKKVHKTDCFDKIVENLELTLELKKKTDSPIDVGVSYVIYPNNISDLKYTEQWLENHHPTYLYFKPGELRAPTALLTTKQKLAFYYVRQIIKRYRGSTDVEIASTKFSNLLNNVQKESRTTCYIGALFPTISANGVIYYCCHTVNKTQFIVGDTNKNSFEEIMQNFKYTNYKDFAHCPRNCRGHIINHDVDEAMDFLNNKHINFL